MNRINSEDYQDDEIVKKMSETYEKYGRYALRNFSIFNNWRKGETYASIGKFYNLHKETVRQIVLKQCRRYNCIKNSPDKCEPETPTVPQFPYEICSYESVFTFVFGNEEWKNPPRDGRYVRVANVLIRNLSKYFYMSDFLKAVTEITDEDYLKMRNAGIRTLPIFHEVRDEARRRLEEDDSRVDTNN